MSERQLTTFLTVLRRLLRANGLSLREIAERMDVGEATVKRWFAGQGLAADRLEDLCALAGISLGELAELAMRPLQGQSTQVTLAQEEALTESPLLSFLFFSILSGWPPSDLNRELGISMKLIETLLYRLERLALIDRLPGGRVRSRVDRRTIWRGPLRRHFEQHMKHWFLEMDYSDPAAIYTVETTKLSPTGLARLQELIERFRRDVQELADDDRRHSLLPKRWHATLVVTRAMDLTQLGALSGEPRDAPRRRAAAAGWPEGTDAV